VSDLGRIIELLSATAEICGAEVRPAALAVMAQDLAAYPLPQIDAALTRVRREVTGRFTLAAVMERLATADGRPTADEAWATALLADDEAETVVWTSETAQAFFAARSVLQSGDKVGARMAFKSAYDRLVSDARAAAAPARWEMSIGHDKERRAGALEKAVVAGILTHDAVKHHLPAPAQTQEGAAIAGLLTGATVETKSKAFNERMARVREAIKGAEAKKLLQESASEAGKAEEQKKQQIRIRAMMANWENGK